jgi:hypothetical protein
MYWRGSLRENWNGNRRSLGFAPNDKKGTSSAVVSHSGQNRAGGTTNIHSSDRSGERRPSAAKAGSVSEAITYALKAVPFRKVHSGRRGLQTHRPSLGTELEAPPPGLKPSIDVPECSRGFKNPLPGLKSGAGTVRRESGSTQRRVLPQPVKSGAGTAFKPRPTPTVKFSRRH